MRRRALERTAILAVLAGAAAACEALVGITDRQLAEQGFDAATDTTTGQGADVASEGTDLGHGNDAGDAPASGVDGSPSADTSADTVPSTEVGTGSDVGLGTDAEASAVADAMDAGIADTWTTDTLTPDTSSPPPDAADAAAPLDPDVPCAQQPSFLFCDDFDLETTVSAPPWDWIPTSDAGVAQIESTIYRSSPHGLQVIVPPSPTTIVVEQLGKNVTMLYNWVRLAFDVRVDVPTYTGLPQVGVAQLYLLRPTGGTVQINFNLGPGSFANLNAFVTDGGSPQITATVPALQQWIRIALAYDSSGSLSLYQNGQLVGTPQNVGAGAPGPVQMIIGAAYVNTNGTATAKYEMDNVVVTGH
jgi:hypothetical protein